MLFGEAVGIQNLLAQLLTQQAGKPAFASIIAAASDSALSA
jgi:hypothetical protein